MYTTYRLRGILLLISLCFLLISCANNTGISKYDQLRIGLYTHDDEQAHNSNWDTDEVSSSWIVAPPSYSEAAISVSIPLNDSFKKFRWKAGRVISFSKNDIDPNGLLHNRFTPNMMKYLNKTELKIDEDGNPPPFSIGHYKKGTEAVYQYVNYLLTWDVSRSANDSGFRISNIKAEVYGATPLFYGEHQLEFSIESQYVGNHKTLVERVFEGKVEQIEVRKVVSADGKTLKPIIVEFPESTSWFYNDGKIYSLLLDIVEHN